MIKMNRIRASFLTAGALAAAFMLGWASDANAAEASAEWSLDEGAAAEAPEAAPRDDSAAFLAAGKVGGILPFSKLGPFVNFGIELGYVFGGTNRSIAVLLDLTYTTPLADGSESDARVPEGEYKWELTQKELVLQPTFLYRFTMLDWGDVTPYAGIGPRIYFLQSVIEGTAGGEEFGETPEQSTKLGFGIPLGAELALGPGGLFAELLFQWGPLDHRITGDSNLGSATLFLGYRALL